MIDLAWLSVIVLVTAATSTLVSLLTLARSRESIDTSRESLAKAEASLFTSRLAAETLPALARGNAADLLEEARVGALSLLKTAACEEVIRKQTAAQHELRG